MQYVKFRFTSANGAATAGLIVPREQFERSSIAELSRLFPKSEALKMERLERSPVFKDFAGAFKYEF